MDIIQYLTAARTMMPAWYFCFFFFFLFSFLFNGCHNVTVSSYHLAHGKRIWRDIVREFSLFYMHVVYIHIYTHNCHSKKSFAKFSRVCKPSQVNAKEGINFCFGIRMGKKSVSYSSSQSIFQNLFFSLSKFFRFSRLAYRTGTAPSNWPIGCSIHCRTAQKQKVWATKITGR